MEEKKESIFKTAILYPFRLIGWMFSALAMDEKGLSLKKILAAFGTWVAYTVTRDHACKENAIMFTAMWLVWVLIVIGIYSAKDVNGLMSIFKGSSQPQFTTQVETKAEVMVAPTQ